MSEHPLEPEEDVPLSLSVEVIYDGSPSRVVLSGADYARFTDFRSQLVDWLEGLRERPAELEQQVALKSLDVDIVTAWIDVLVERARG